MTKARSRPRGRIGIEERESAEGADYDGGPSPLFIALGWLRQIWDVEWGEVPGENAVFGVLSASAGLFVALVVGTVIQLQQQDFDQLVLDFLEASATAAFGMSAIAAVLGATILVIVLLAMIAMFGGSIIYLSSSPRSYLSHVWRGALVLVVGIVVFVIAKGIMSLSKLMG